MPVVSCQIRSSKRSRINQERKRNLSKYRSKYSASDPTCSTISQFKLFDTFVIIHDRGKLCRMDTCPGEGGMQVSNDENRIRSA